ncbi:MAG: UDP-N-acetylglucosamine 1-carboxyvinyltransferase [Clostridia bacterium]|nr:UDP-N-acetylglucosamine 1-carboxyvinyltransferase [Clostridia bacterium]
MRFKSLVKDLRILGGESLLKGKFVVVGGERLSGKVRVNGAKNSALPIMAATLLAEGKSTILSIPNLKDVTVFMEVLESLGAAVKREGHKLEVDATNLNACEVPSDFARKFRASNLVMGPLLARLREVRSSYPGGCAIGSRPMDLHLKGLASLGSSVKERGGFVHTSTDGLRGSDIHMDFPSVGATENIMLAATLAEGETIIRNAAREPEIVDLQNFLNSMGAKVKGAGTGTVGIKGVKKLHGAEHEIIPDRIETATLMIASAITGGDVCIENAIPEHVEPVIAKLTEMGVDVLVDNDSIRVMADQVLGGVNIKTLPYPGFPTDVQPQMVALLSTAKGTSLVTETIFENRFKHTAELRRMGADITVEGRTAVIKGMPKLSGAFVEATDLRAGIALILAGLAAEDMTVVENAGHIDRGYENIAEKLKALGAKIIRIEN